MDLQNILNFSVPKGSVLFADNACSTALSLMFKFDDLVPKKFALISNLENDYSIIQNLLERFISMLEFEHIILLVSSPICQYKKHIQTILEFDFDIYKICTTIQNDDFSMLPKSISGNSNIVQVVDQFLIPITDYFSFIPSFPSVMPNIISNSSGDYEEFTERVSSAIQNVLNQIQKNTNNGIKSYSYGDFSKCVAESLENGRKGENLESVAILIDRNSCCTPLFTDNGSLLDKAASDDLVSVLQDFKIIKEEMNVNLLPTLCKILEMDEKSNFLALSKKWKSFSEKEKIDLLQKYPSLKSIFENSSDDLISQKILNAQESLLNGADFDDIFACYCNSLKPNQLIKIIGFQNCIHRINYQEYLSDIISNDESFSNDEEKYNRILENCYSGFNFDLKKRSTFKLDELFFLPNLLNFIFDKNATVNEEIIAPSSSLMSLFKSSHQSLKTYNKVYVFVIGGVSFRELVLLEKMAKSKNTNTEFHIFSDTICSAIHLFD